MQMIPLSSNRKATGVVVPVSPGRCRSFIKGASETLMKKCMLHVIRSKSPAAVCLRSADKISYEDISCNVTLLVVM